MKQKKYYIVPIVRIGSQQFVWGIIVDHPPTLSRTDIQIDLTNFLSVPILIWNPQLGIYLSFNLRLPLAAA